MKKYIAKLGMLLILYLIFNSCFAQDLFNISNTRYIQAEVASGQNDTTKHSSTLYLQPYQGLNFSTTNKASAIVSISLKDNRVLIEVDSDLTDGSPLSSEDKGAIKNKIRFNLSHEDHIMNGLKNNGVIKLAVSPQIDKIIDLSTKDLKPKIINGIATGLASGSAYLNRNTSHPLKTMDEESIRYDSERQSSEREIERISKFEHFYYQGDLNSANWYVNVKTIIDLTPSGPNISFPGLPSKYQSDDLAKKLYHAATAKLIKFVTDNDNYSKFKSGKVTKYHGLNISANEIGLKPLTSVSLPIEVKFTVLSDFIDFGSNGTVRDISYEVLGDYDSEITEAAIAAAKELNQGQYLEIGSSEIINVSVDTLVHIDQAPEIRLAVHDGKDHAIRLVYFEYDGQKKYSNEEIYQIMSFLSSSPYVINNHTYSTQDRYRTNNVTLRQYTQNGKLSNMWIQEYFSARLSESYMRSNSLMEKTVVYENGDTWIQLIDSKNDLAPNEQLDIKQYLESIEIFMQEQLNIAYANTELKNSKSFNIILRPDESNILKKSYGLGETVKNIIPLINGQIPFVVSNGLVIDKIQVVATENKNKTAMKINRVNIETKRALLGCRYSWAQLLL